MKTNTLPGQEEEEREREGEGDGEREGERERGEESAIHTGRVEQGRL